MAGAGYKLFNTGDVLTAAQVNTYLMEQTVMVFASAAARTSALSGVLAEGMVSYLQDTNTLEVYDGSNWVGATGDITGLTAGTGISISSATGPVPTITNDVATEFDAKGDLVVGTGADTFDRLAAGSNGDTLVADSSAITGLRWQGNFAAGKNAIINGDFRINQRAFSSTTTSGTYTFDRWRYGTVGGTCTASAQTFTAGSAPVAGYEGINFIQIVTSGQSATSDLTFLTQRIEDVRVFANQTVTVSFWAKANTGTPKIAAAYTQNFGSGGSSNVSAAVGQVTLSTSWARYSVSVAIPSISGKTLGASNYLELELWVSGGSDYNARTGSLGIQSNTFQIWGVQMEAGSVATPFATATGTLAGERSACERYFYRTTFDRHFTFVRDSNLFWFQFKNPTTMRSAPSISTNLTTKVASSSGMTAAQVALYYGSFIAGTSAITLNTDAANIDEVSVYFSGATVTQGTFPTAQFNGGYFDVSAEL